MTPNRETVNAMKFASAWSAQSSSLAALDEAASQVSAELGNDVDLLLLFISAQHVSEARTLLSAARERFGSATVLGCSASSVLASGKELEEGPALSLTGAQLPDVTLTPFRLEELPDGPDGFRDAVGAKQSPSGLIVLPDPYSMDVDALVRSLDRAFPEAVQVGGIASGADEPGEARVMLNDQAFGNGAVGLALSGNIRVDALVAQGCRPVGRPMIVTAYRDNIIYSFDCGRPDEQLRALYADLEGRDKELFKTSLFVGIEMKNKMGEYRQGDFLVRALIGIDPESGAMAVGSPVHPYQVAQFHLRDGETSAADLQQRLERYASEYDTPPAGVLLFSCLGRGKDLYEEPDHDSKAIVEQLGVDAIGGFFCNGEIGPVGGRTFVHGYTSAIALFRPAK